VLNNRNAEADSGQGRKTYNSRTLALVRERRSLLAIFMIFAEAAVLQVHKLQVVRKQPFCGREPSVIVTRAAPQTQLLNNNIELIYFR
jgi:hypothetical protein